MAYAWYRRFRPVGVITMLLGLVLLALTLIVTVAAVHDSQLKRQRRFLRVEQKPDFRTPASEVAASGPPHRAG
jgi:hypothetical protein